MSQAELVCMAVRGRVCDIEKSTVSLVCPAKE